MTWLDCEEQRGDWLVAAKVMVDRAWTLTSMGKHKQLEEAEELFARAWELRRHQEPLFRINLARNIAVLRIQQQRFDEAQIWLAQTIELLQQTQLEEQQRLRQLVQIRYYQGEIFFKNEEYQQAKIIFQQALEYAQSMDWRRAIFCTQNWLAEFLRLINSEENQKFTLTQTIIAIVQYGMFLSLIQKHPHVRMVPNQEIDAVFHAHIADAYQFEKDCQNLFNTYLKHVTEVGIRGDAERQEWLLAFSHTHKLFEQNFGHGTMGSSIAACCEILFNFA